MAYKGVKRSTASPSMDGGRGATQRAPTTTARKRADAAFDLKIRTVAEHTFDWDYWIRPDGRLEYMSPSCERVTGHRADEFIANPGLLISIVHPDDRPLVTRHVESVARDEFCDADLDFRIVTPSGDTRWLNHVCRPIHGQSGEYLGRRASNRDISRRRLAEALADARLELSNLATTAALDGILQRTLDAAEALTGSCIGFYHFVADDQVTLSLQAWSTNTLQRMCTAEGKGQHYPADQAGVWANSLRQRQPIIYEDYATLPDRKGMPEGHAVVHRFITVPVIRQDRVVALLGVGNKPAPYRQQDLDAVSLLASEVWDIVERKRAEEALRVSEQKYRTLLDHLPDLVWQKDLDGRYVSCNAHYAEVLGVTPAAIVGRRDGDLYPPDLAARYRADDERVQATGQAIETEEPSEHQGSRRLFHTRKSPAFDAQGRCIGTFGIARDITEQAKTAAERDRLQQQLQHTRKIESIGRLAGGIAHDFNNILTVVMMRLNLLMENRTFDADVRESILELAAQAQRAAGLTRQLLMFSRRAVLDLKPLDLDAAMGNMVAMLRRLLGEHIDIVFRPHGTLPAVRADVSLMEQVLVNLSLNARDAMPAGGRLTITTGPVDVTPEGAAASPDMRPGLFVCLSVADSGSGMDEATVRRVFEPFFTTKEVGKGTGLGLATVHGIVAQHAGWIEVESAPGRGSTFRVYLPALAERPAATAAAAPRPASPAGGHETILVVEDEEMVRRVAVRLLSVMGYHVLEAASGREALEVWQTAAGRVDLLLTDLVMPEGTSGLELARRLRELRPGLPVILSSGYSAEMVDDGAPGGAGILYLPKPYQAAELRAAIRRCLDDARHAD